jgi:WD40 repeat protein
MAVLQSFRRAQEAEYRHGSRKGCLEGTRIAVLDEIELWTRDPSRPPVYWLNGLAGTGKSTIAQTIAERMFADERLGGSFFCSRDSADRSNLRLIFPTLAVQLARKYSEFRSSLVPLVRSDPECATESLQGQMWRMIVGPLKKSAISTVIVIDALDECKDEESESGILSVIGQFTSEIPNVKFFLTGRPEPHILQGFGLPKMVEARDVFVLHEVEPSEIGGDIRRFFEHWFSDITRRHGMDGWPTTQQLDQLCERAAGLFVYAMATVKFINDHDPRKRLDRLLQSPKSSAHEGKTKFKENTTLDSLYISILQQAFGDEDPEDDLEFRRVLSAVVLVANPLSPSIIATLLSSNTKTVFSRLSSIHSLLILQEDVHVHVLPFHKSFPDFITNQTRCINKRFYISPPDHHLDLLVGCLNLMGQRLEENMCGLPDTITNDEVDDLDEKARLSIDEGLKYACESWHKHLVDEHMARAPEVTSALHQFLEKKFLCWLEVLSILGSAREAVDALGAAAKLLEVCQVICLSHFPNLPGLIQESPTLSLVNDCFRFVTGFFKIISTSTPHIHHSALPLSPQMSIVHKLYEPCASPLVRIVHGVSTSWNPDIMTGRFGFPRETVWSSCSKFIVVTQDFGGMIEVLDGMTLKSLTVLSCGLSLPRSLIFSPNSHLLTWISDHPMQCISWDLRTGVQFSAIQLSATLPEPGWSIEWGSLLTYSGCGTMLGVLFPSDNTSVISIYNIFSNTHIHSHQVGCILGRKIWTHGECIRYTTFVSQSIIIWEFGFTSRCEPTQVKALSTPDNFDPSRGLLIHPTLYHLAFINQGILVWDCQESQFLLEEQDLRDPKGMSFSLDGCFFACGAFGGEIYLWKKSLVGYVLYRKFQAIHKNTKYSLNHISPDGGSITACSPSSVQVWHTMDPVTSPPSISTQTPPWTGNSMVEFSPDEVYAAITQVHNNVVTVLDLKSGDPWLVIDTGVKVDGLGVGRSAIIIVGEGKIVTWDLSAGNCAPNARASINNSAQITQFAQPPPIYHIFYCPISISADLRHMVLLGGVEGSGLQRYHVAINLHLFNVSTGQCLASVSTEQPRKAWFTPDGHGIWSHINQDNVEGWSIIEDRESNITRLEHIGVTTDPAGGLPWQSPHGYQVTDDGWVLNPGGKRLLWLPPNSWSNSTNLVWSGKFLALLGSKQPEPVLLELPVE